MEILNLIDDHSRLCVGSQALTVFKAHDVEGTFSKAAAAYGNPASLLSDNGAVSPAATAHGPRRPGSHPARPRHRFCHSRPYHPQTCGKLERLHQTLEKWLARQPPAPTLANYKPSSTPSAPTTTRSGPTAPWAGAPRAQRLPQRPRAAPTGTPLHGGAWRIRHDRIDPSGMFTLRHNSRLHHMEWAPLRRHRRPGPVHDLHVRVLTTDGNY